MHISKNKFYKKILASLILAASVLAIVFGVLYLCDSRADAKGLQDSHKVTIKISEEDAKIGYVAWSESAYGHEGKFNKTTVFYTENSTWTYIDGFIRGDAVSEDKTIECDWFKAGFIQKVSPYDAKFYLKGSSEPLNERTDFDVTNDQEITLKFIPKTTKNTATINLVGGSIANAPTGWTKDNDGHYTKQFITNTSYTDILNEWDNALPNIKCPKRKIINNENPWDPKKSYDQGLSTDKTFYLQYIDAVAATIDLDGGTYDKLPDGWDIEDNKYVKYYEKGTYSSFVSYDWLSSGVNLKKGEQVFYSTVPSKPVQMEADFNFVANYKNETNKKIIVLINNEAINKAAFTVDDDPSQVDYHTTNVEDKSSWHDENETLYVGDHKFKAILKTGYEDYTIKWEKAANNEGVIEKDSTFICKVEPKTYNVNINITNIGKGDIEYNDSIKSESFTIKHSAHSNYEVKACREHQFLILVNDYDSQENLSYIQGVPNRKQNTNDSYGSINGTKLEIGDKGIIENDITIDITFFWTPVVYGDIINADTGKPMLGDWDVMTFDIETGTTIDMLEPQGGSSKYEIRGEVGKGFILRAGCLAKDVTYGYKFAFRDGIADEFGIHKDLYISKNVITLSGQAKHETNNKEPAFIVSDVDIKYKMNNGSILETYTEYGFSYEMNIPKKSSGVISYSAPGFGTQSITVTEEMTSKDCNISLELQPVCDLNVKAPEKGHKNYIAKYSLDKKQYDEKSGSTLLEKINKGSKITVDNNTIRYENIFKCKINGEDKQQDFLIELTANPDANFQFADWFINDEKAEQGYSKIVDNDIDAQASYKEVKVDPEPIPTPEGGSSSDIDNSTSSTSTYDLMFVVIGAIVIVGFASAVYLWRQYRRNN